MGDSITMHPAQVRAWGLAAQTSGGGVRSARARVTEAEEEMAVAYVQGMRCHGASQRYTDAIESGLKKVGENVTGTGEKLVTSAAIVRSTDDESVALFTRYGWYRP